MHDCGRLVHGGHKAVLQRPNGCLQLLLLSDRLTMHLMFWLAMSISMVVTFMFMRFAMANAMSIAIVEQIGFVGLHRFVLG